MKKRKTRSDKGKTLKERVGKQKAIEIGEKIRKGKIGLKRPDIKGNLNPMRRPEIAIKVSESQKGKIIPEEIRKRISKTLMGHLTSKETKEKMRGPRPNFCGENNPSWKGGTDWYNSCHKKVWKLFGKDYCQHCGITNRQHKQKYKQRLHMHNNLIPKDYSKIDEDSWLTLCKSCHKILEASIQRGE